MNQIINSISMKHFDFKTIDDINNFRRMTRTSQAIYLAEQIQSFIKIVDKHKVYYFDRNKNLWVLMTFIEYRFFISNYLNESSILIKQIKKSYEDLPDEIDKQINVLCRLFDNMTYIKDIMKRSFTMLLDKDFVLVHSKIDT